LIQLKPVGKKTDYRPAFRMLTKVLRRRSALMVISDFTDPLPPDLAGVLARRHELMAAVMMDPLEQGCRAPARLAVRDPETGRVGYLSAGSNKAIEKANALREEQLRVWTNRGADRLNLTAGHNVVPPLIGFFRKRHERM